MNSLYDNLLVASLVGSILALVLLSGLRVLRDYIPPVWLHALLLVAVLRFIWVFPVPSSPLSWNRIVTNEFSFTEHVGPAERTAEDETSNEAREESEVNVAGAQTPIANDRETVKVPVSPLEVKVSLLEGLCFLWLAGTTLMICLWLWSAICTTRLIQKARRAGNDHAIQDYFNSAIEKSGLRLRPKLLFSDRILAPALAGIFMPSILLPEKVCEHLNEDELVTVLLHELGHLRRCDLITQLALSIMQAIHWWNPLVWLLSRQIRLLAERATDRWVLARMGEIPQSTYGSALLNLLELSERSLQCPTLLTVGVAENKRHLTDRIRSIVAYRKRSLRLVGGLSALALVVISFVALSQSPARNHYHRIDFVAVDQQGEPVPYARVSVFLDPGWRGNCEYIKTLECDEFGRLRDDSLLLDKAVRLVVTDPSDQLIAVTTFLGDKGSEVGSSIDENGCLVMSPSEDLNLKFVEKLSGKSIGKLSVRILLHDSGDDFGSVDAFAQSIPARSDSDGRVSVKAIKGRFFSVRHQRKGLQLVDNESDKHDRVSDREEFVYRLAKAHVIKGRVVLPDRTPVVGASLFSFNGLASIGAMTDDQGRYELGHLIPGVEVTMQTFMPDELKSDWYLGNQTVQLPVHGDVTVHDVQAKKGAVLVLNYSDIESGRHIRNDTLSGVDPKLKSFDLDRVDRPQKYHAPRDRFLTVDFSRSERIEVDIPLKRIQSTDTVKGIVLDSVGKPVGGVRVSTIPGSYPEKILTNEKGEFSYLYPDRKSHRTKRLALIAEGGGLSSGKYYWAHGSKTVVELNLSEPTSGSISGTVRNESNEPIEGVKVTLYGEGEYRVEQHTNYQGEYLFDQARSGVRLWLQTDHLDYGRVRDDDKWEGLRSLYLKGEQAMSIPPMVLPRSDRTISGRLLNSDRSPIYNAILTVLPRDGQPMRLVASKADGNFSFSGLIDATHQIEVRRNTAMRKENQQTHTFVVEGGAESVELVMPKNDGRLGSP